MLAFLELTPRFERLKRRESLEFCVHLDMSQIGIACFAKQCLGFSKFRNFQNFRNYRDFTSFSETQAKKTLK